MHHRRPSMNKNELKKKKKDHSSTGKDVEQLENIVTVKSIEEKILKNYVAVSYTVKHTSAYKPTIPILGIYSRKMKTHLQEDPLQAYSKN